MTTKLTALSLTAALLVPVGLTSCETPGEGAKTGAIVGAGIGALTRGDLRGAIQGAAIGAASGAILGKLNRDDRRREREYVRVPDDEYARYPTARPTRDYGYVQSPYRPYNLIDVRGIPRGAVVEDPSTGGRFINP